MPRTGRPSSLDKVVAHGQGGLDITVSDRIVQAVRVGTPFEGAAAAASISTPTLYGWLKEGARIAAKVATVPGFNRGNLSARERRLMDFANALNQALGEWETNCNALLERLAVGGTELVTITEKRTIDPDGNESVIDRSTKVARLGPDGNILLKRLAMRFPDRYAMRTEVTGPEGEAISIEVRAANLADALRRHQAGRHELEQAN